MDPPCAYSAYEPSYSYDYAPEKSAKCKSGIKEQEKYAKDRSKPEQY
jgi:hypothetical protein